MNSVPAIYFSGDDNSKFSMRYMRHLMQKTIKEWGKNVLMTPQDYTLIIVCPQIHALVLVGFVLWFFFCLFVGFCFVFVWAFYLVIWEFCGVFCFVWFFGFFLEG